MTCQQVDELAAAYALGAVEPDEDRAISTHIATCDRPHAEARAMLDAGAAVPASVDAVEPAPALRSRLMATIAATPQDHRAAEAATPLRPVPSTHDEPRPWWRLAPLPAGLAAVGLAAVIGLGAWNVTLNQQLAARDRALRAVAGADVAHAVSGPAGSGWVLETDGQAIFLAESLAALPADRIYELWLIDPDGTPTAVGVLQEVDGLALVTLERELGPATVFAVTVEASRVDAPTSDPVLVATLEG